MACTLANLARRFLEVSPLLYNSYVCICHDFQKTRSSRVSTKRQTSIERGWSPVRVFGIYETLIMPRRACQRLEKLFGSLLGPNDPGQEVQSPHRFVDTALATV